MSEYIDMSKYESFDMTLEEYVNEKGYTLGDKADELQKLLDSISYCYVSGVLTDSQTAQANEKFKKQLGKALYKLSTD